MKTRVKLSFNLILTLAVMLTMAQTAWAATIEETVTFYMDGGASGNTSVQDDWTLASSGKTLHWSNNNPSQNKLSWGDNKASFYSSVNEIKCNGVIEFPNLEGTVKRVELTNFRFYWSGMQMHVGLNKNNTSTLLHLQGATNDYDFPSSDISKYTNSATFEGSVAVSSSNPLKIMFSCNDEENPGDFGFKNGTIVITYDVEVEDTSDPGHTFTFSASGNTLTATCNQTSQHHNCILGVSRTSTLTLTATDASYDWLKHSASLNLTDFSEETGITDIKTTFNYTNNATSVSSGTAPSEIGDYTVTVTVIINSDNEHPYVLTTNFSILAGFNINNKYSQFSLSKSSALEGEAITITYTQQMDEILEGLTLTGATSGNSIAYTKSGNTYTFNMPAEDVNLSATFTYPLNENNITQSGDTYTIKTAEGWNYFCQRLEVDGDLNGFSGKTVMLGDNITVTTMAGSTDHPFKGMFDGDGHTLTFNHTADRSNCAPFRTTNGATIRNLHATGQIDGGIWHYMGGLVGSANGKLTIENCRVSTQISSTVSGIANNGGFVGYLSSQYNQCYITGCVFDGLICNSNTWNQTYGCGGFVGAMSEYGYAMLEDCLFIHGQYDNNNGKCELWWGNENDKNSTFVGYDMSNGGAKFTNCFYVGTRGLKQGSPAVESATAPANFAHFGTPTDYRFMKMYGHTMVFGGKYYTPIYGDLVEEYAYNGVKYYTIEYDDAPLGIPDITSPLWTEGLRYNRSFTAGKPVTIMLPFNFKRDRITLAGSNKNPSGKFYEFKGIEENQDHKWVAVMIEAGETLSNEVVETTLKANTPYLYVPGESTEYLDIYVGGTGINIFTEGNEGGTKETEYYYGDGMPWNHWMFKGTYLPRYWSETEHFEEVGKVYGFAGARKEVDGKLVEAGEFVRAKVGAKIRPTSCYLKWVEPQTDYAPARALTRSAAATEELPQSITVKLISASGETTAIGTLDTKTGEMTFDSEAWYTLDGIRLSGKPSTKGIYINNGKKVVIK